MQYSKHDIEIGQIYASEHKVLRRMWCLNLTSAMLTLFIFKEKKVLIKNLLLTILPLLLQMYHIFTSGTKESRFTWWLTMIASAICSLACLILICVMIMTTI